MAYEDQRAAHEADVAGGDRRTAKQAEGAADPRYEPVDGFLCSKGIRFLEETRPVGKAAAATARDHVPEVRDVPWTSCTTSSTTMCMADRSVEPGGRDAAALRNGR